MNTENLENTIGNIESLESTMNLESIVNIAEEEVVEVSKKDQTLKEVVIVDAVAMENTGAESSEAEEMENTEVAVAVNIEVVATANTEVAAVVNTEVVVTENTEVAVAENTEVAETANTEVVVTENIEVVAEVTNKIMDIIATEASVIMISHMSIAAAVADTETEIREKTLMKTNKMIHLQWSSLKEANVAEEAVTSNLQHLINKMTKL